MKACILNMDQLEDDIGEEFGINDLHVLFEAQTKWRDELLQTGAVAIPLPMGGHIVLSISAVSIPPED